MNRVLIIVSRVNAESSLLLMGLVLLGSLLQAALTLFALEFFVEGGDFWPVILWPLPLQALQGINGRYSAWPFISGCSSF